MIAPTLVIGLGGTGSKIVSYVEQKATAEQKERLSFIIFDTDANELRDLNKKGYTGAFIQTSTNMTVGEYLNVDHNCRDEVFPVNNILNRKTLTEGAGQVRSISRLAFDAVVRGGNMEPLHKAIEKLYALRGDATEQALRVIIVSSLAGGTGSGLILPVAMYLKNYLVSRYQQNSSVIRGFFVLPEVFYKLGKSESEQKSLSANAYATLRELDAFLMRGDGTLPERYKNLNFVIPRAGTNEYDNYDVMPYDFCFLYDAQNVNSAFINSFADSIRHVADCIYAQSISPMSKRSNSSEDNVIRELCRSGGRNRYCGAGTASLIYPYTHVREFIALNWARDVIGKQWMQYDTLYEEERIRMKEKMRKTGSTEKLLMDRFYVDTVDSTADKNNDLSAEIRSACYDIIPGEPDPVGRWFKYLAKLEEYVSNDVIENQTETNELRDSCLSTLQVMGSKDNRTADRMHELSDQVNSYYTMASSEVKRVASSVAYNLFTGLKNPMANPRPYYLEYWLQYEGQAIHPNAMRYFIYKLIAAMRTRKSEAEAAIEEVKEFWNEGFPKQFDNPKTKKKEETQEETLGNLKDQGLFNKEEYERLIAAYNGFVQNTETYRVQYIWQKVLEYGIDYLAKMAEAMELFYKNLGGSIDQMESRQQEIRGMFKNDVASPVRYVCASAKCMDKFAERTVSTGTVAEVPGELSATIYDIARNYVIHSDLQTDKYYFTEAFQNDVMQFWNEYIDKLYGNMLDMNVLQAMEQEAEFEQGIYKSDKKIFYIESIFDEMVKLSAPFITKPLGEERRIISSCTFSDELRKWADNSSEMKSLVKRRMLDVGGEEDDTGIDKYQIIFYQSMYGLRAVDLAKFAPPSYSPTVPNSPGGSYYTAYYELINKIHPSPERTKYITPHIHRSWHYITSLPELDEANQELLEKEICRAMIYGLVLGKISYNRVSSYTEKYRYLVKLSGEEREGLVSNDQECDQFYEVLIGLIKNHNLVEGIIKSCQSEIEEELNTKLELENSMVIQALNKFHVEEVSTTDVRSLFEIPLLYSQSAPKSSYDEHFAHLLMQCTLEMLHQYLGRYLRDDDLDYNLGMLITSQYALFKDNLLKLQQKWPRIGYDPLITDMKVMISEYLKKLEFRAESEWVLDKMTDEEYAAYAQAAATR